MTPILRNSSSILFSGAVSIMVLRKDRTSDFRLAGLFVLEMVLVSCLTKGVIFFQASFDDLLVETQGEIVPENGSGLASYP
jgi:hypothetical protein